MPRSIAKKTKAAQPAVTILFAPELEEIPALTHGFSTRLGGHSQEYGKNQLNLGFTASDKRETVERNRAEFLKILCSRQPENQPGKKSFELLTLKQVHSSIIHVLDSPERLPARGKVLVGDGLITNLGGVLLGVQTADCMPVLIADPVRRVVAAVHAGWRGTVKRIAEKAVGTMRSVFGSEPGDLRAAIGPGIHACCYAVGDEVIHEFESQFSYAGELFREVYDKDPVKRKYPLLFMTARAPGHSDIGPQIHLNLVEANRRQLLSAGLNKKHIWAAEECTSCRTDLLFSHRAEDGYTGRMLAVIGFGHD